MSNPPEEGCLFFGGQLTRNGMTIPFLEASGGVLPNSNPPRPAAYSAAPNFFLPIWERKIHLNFHRLVLLPVWLLLKLQGNRLPVKAGFGFVAVIFSISA